MTEKYKLQKVLIAGAGAMGSGIAYLFARAYPEATVDVVEPSAQMRERAQEQFARWNARDTARDQAKGITTSSDCSNRIRLFPDFQKAATDYCLLLEAVPENLELKKTVFREFSTRAKADAIFASNTSSLSVTSLAAVLAKEQQANAIGLHFFNPPRVMQLIEIIITENTSPETEKRARAIAADLGKKAVVCRDAPGFITSRLGIVLLNEAIFALQEGLMSAEEIDTAMKLGYNFPMGPLELADFIGLDVVFAVTQSLYENYQDPKYRPCLLLRKKVEAGHLGRKTGRGFYVYGDK
ncbi:MAG: 3-hydroxyacyl-CoA dehydrogenase NAD-binding domain-containing protein [Leptospiraceae bacterium]|nr:3-hydroxyacyl-CoA dehydrogenase NAD-binding domain-containing protein [Leptospiraceae bacterium]